MPVELNVQIPVIDGDALDEIREVLEEEFDDLIEEFKSDTQDKLNKMESAAVEGDLEQLFILAHTLGSSSAHLGFMQLSHYSRWIEARSRESANEDYITLVARIKRHYQDVLNALDQQ